MDNNIDLAQALEALRQIVVEEVQIYEGGHNMPVIFHSAGSSIASKALNLTREDLITIARNKRDL